MRSRLIVSPASWLVVVGMVRLGRLVGVAACWGWRLRRCGWDRGTDVSLCALGGLECDTVRF
jgi:hypothetical protein